MSIRITKSGSGKSGARAHLGNGWSVTDTGRQNGRLRTRARRLHRENHGKEGQIIPKNFEYAQELEKKEKKEKKGDSGERKLARRLQESPQ